MAMTEQRKQYLYNYQKENIKRVPLDMQKSDYERLAAAAAGAGMKVNGYIKQAIDEKIEREEGGRGIGDQIQPEGCEIY